MYNGGDGIVREMLFRKPLTLSVLTERRAFRPYGLEGIYKERTEIFSSKFVQFYRSRTHVLMALPLLLVLSSGSFLSQIFSSSLFTLHSPYLRCEIELLTFFFASNILLHPI